MTILINLDKTEIVTILLTKDKYAGGCFTFQLNSIEDSTPPKGRVLQFLQDTIVAIAPRS